MANGRLEGQTFVKDYFKAPHVAHQSILDSFGPMRFVRELVGHSRELLVNWSSLKVLAWLMCLRLCPRDPNFVGTPHWWLCFILLCLKCFNM